MQFQRQPGSVSQPKIPKRKTFNGLLWVSSEEDSSLPFTAALTMNKSNTDTLKNHLLMHLKMPSLNVILLHLEVRCCG